jgi:hypothetical protein
MLFRDDRRLLGSNSARPTDRTVVPECLHSINIGMREDPRSANPEAEKTIRWPRPPLEKPPIRPERCPVGFTDCAPWADLPDRDPSFQTCHRRVQQWVRSAVMIKIMTALAHELSVRGSIDVREAFIDASFAPAKKGHAK